MDSNDTMDTSSGSGNQSEQLYYWCENCNRSFTGSQSFEEHLNNINCWSMSVMPGSETFDENTLRVAILEEKSTLAAFINARNEANSMVMRCSEVLKQKREAQQFLENVVARETTLHTVVSREGHLILSDIAKETWYDFQACMRELQMLTTELTTVLGHLKDLNRTAISAVAKVDSAYFKAARASRERLTSATSAQENARVERIIKLALDSRQNILAELLKSIEILENAVSEMQEDDSKEEPKKTTENASGTNLTQNTRKRKFHETMVMEDDPMPSTFRDRKREFDLMLKEMKKEILCVRRLDFS